MRLVFENRSFMHSQIVNEREGRQIGGRKCFYYLKIDHWVAFKIISPNSIMKESINPDNYLQEFSGRATDRAVLKNSFGIEGLNICDNEK